MTAPFVTPEEAQEIADEYVPMLRAAIEDRNPRGFTEAEARAAEEYLHDEIEHAVRSLRLPEEASA